MPDRLILLPGGKIAFDGQFDGLRAITGNLTRLTVTTGNGHFPSFDRAVLLSGENGVYEYEIDLAGLPIKQLMKTLSEFDGVRDVEIRKAPIEQVIARLYERWRHEAV